MSALILHFEFMSLFGITDTRSSYNISDIKSSFSFDMLNFLFLLFLIYFYYTFIVIEIDLYDIPHHMIQNKPVVKRLHDG